MSAEPHAPDPRPRRERTPPLVWVISTYFAEGFPYTIVNNLAEVLFTTLGTSLKGIGLTALFHLPWNLKFLWGPYVDIFESKRRWLLITEIVLCVGLAGLVLVAESDRVIFAVSAVFVVMAVISATHDIAIDGYYLEALDDKQQATYVGLRAGAYKTASWFVNGPLLVVVGAIGWRWGWLVAAAMMLGLTLVHAFLLPRIETRGRAFGSMLTGFAWRSFVLKLVVLAGLLGLELAFAPVRAVWSRLTRLIDATPGLGALGAADWIGLALLAALLVMLAALGRIQRRLRRSDSAYARSFLDFLAQPRIGRVLAFVILFRVGESFLMKMRFPFLSRQLGVEVETYGVLNGIFGFGATLVATMLGGWLIGKHGLRRWLWPFMLAQNILNLSYMAIAMPDPASVGLPAIAVVLVLEHFGAGLGTAVLMVYLMRCVDPRHKAAHFAVLTALMSLGFTFAGLGSGYLAESLGFALYFGFTFIATIPSMILVFFVPHLDGREAPPSPRDAQAAAAP